MGREGKLRVFGVAAFSFGNAIADLLLATAWRHGGACAPRQKAPPDGQLFTYGLAMPSLVFAILGAILTFFFHGIGAYRAIRDDEVYDVVGVIYWSRFVLTFVTDIPLFLMQLFMIGSVGMPHNFFLIKFSMTVFSLLLHGWTLLRMKLDRYGLLWGPMREHKRFTIVLAWLGVGAVLPLIWAFLSPKALPAGYELYHFNLYARKFPLNSADGAACTYSYPAVANWTIYQVRRFPTWGASSWSLALTIRP